MRERFFPRLMAANPKTFVDETGENLDPFRIWATLVTLIMLGFFAAVVRSYALGLQINCGCFATPEPLTIQTVFRDGALVALALLMTIFAFLEARKPHPWSAPEKVST